MEKLFLKISQTDKFLRSVTLKIIMLITLFPKEFFSNVSFRKLQRLNFRLVHFMINKNILILDSYSSRVGVTGSPDRFAIQQKARLFSYAYFIIRPRFLVARGKLTDMHVDNSS